jgi:hypothetical protein
MQWFRAMQGMQQHLHTCAATGETPYERASRRACVRIIAATLFSLTALACGKERPPWTGFPLLPPDASTFELSPQLASSFAAAEAAFVAQLAAGQGVDAAGAGAAPVVSPNVADAGIPHTAAETHALPESSQKAGEPRKPPGPDAGPEMMAAAGGRSDEPIQPVAADLDAATPTGAAGHAGASGSEIDADTAMVADAGGHAGTIGPTVPLPQPSGPDAGTAEPDADGGG